MIPADYSQLTGLWSSFPGTTMTGADGEEGFLRFLERNSEHCFTATDQDGSVTGSVMAGNDGRRGYIYHLAVEESRQDHGTGRMLMDTVEESLRSAGIEKIHLFIYRDNPAISFYERIGWHRRPDIEVMSRVLSGDEYTGTRHDTD
jgi:ribosomal protein S18 acetylase RimI-like enzyme